MTGLVCSSVCKPGIYIKCAEYGHVRVDHESSGLGYSGPSSPTTETNEERMPALMDGPRQKTVHSWIFGDQQEPVDESMRSRRGRNNTRLVEKVARAHQATKSEVICELCGDKDHVPFDPKCYWQQAGGHPRAHHITKRNVRRKDCGEKGHARGDWECYWQHRSHDEMSSVELSSESERSSFDDFTASTGLDYGPYSGPSSPKTPALAFANVEEIY